MKRSKLQRQTPKPMKPSNKTVLSPHTAAETLNNLLTPAETSNAQNLKALNPKP